MLITQGVRRAAQVNRDGTATIDGQRRRTWSEFAGRVARLAGALQGLGLEAGDRVATLAFNSDRYLEQFFAIPWAGGIIVPLNTRLALAELSYMLNDAGAQILIVDEAHKSVASELTATVPAIKHVILAGDQDAPDGFLDHEAILSAAEPIPDTAQSGDDVVGIFYTGGTTGLPKGVMLTHRNIVSNALVALLNIYEGTPMAYLHSAPMFHIADCQWNMGVTLHAGTHVFMPRFVPEEMLKAVETYQVTHCALVPTMVNMLCNLNGRENYDVSTLRGVNYGGSPMPPALIARAREAFPHWRFFQGYGQTETAPNISMLTDQYHVLEGPMAAKVGSAGQPVFTMEVRIVDPQDQEIPHGEIGEIVTRGPNVMAGYWNKPDETANALRGGWMHTGDLGYMDEDGFLYVVDRLKDMIITGGENVYSAEVEGVIYKLSAVAVCAVFGIPDDKWGEAIHAVIVPKEGQSISGEEVISFCRKHIAGYKCPRSIEIRTEPLPMTGAGKILKRELRRPFWEGKTRAVN
jgi:acyl-CoA synthetase (AMP-forming)/AMP-acid ligase II